MSGLYRESNVYNTLITSIRPMGGLLLSSDNLEETGPFLIRLVGTLFRLGGSTRTALDDDFDTLKILGV